MECFLHQWQVRKSFFCIFYFTSIVVVYDRYSVQNYTLIKIDGCSNIGVVLLL